MWIPFLLHCARNHIPWRENRGRGSLWRLPGSYPREKKPGFGFDSQENPYPDPAISGETGFDVIHITLKHLIDFFVNGNSKKR